MPCVWAGLALTLALLGGCARSAKAKSVQWRQAAPGLEYSQVTLREDPTAAEVSVHFMRVDSKRLALQVVTAPADLHLPLSDAASFRKAAHGLAAINGGYFDPQFKPLGLLVSQGQELSRVRHVDHGIFYIADGRAGLQHARDWRAPQHLEFAVECGPRLLVDGQPLGFKPGAARRVAIGADAQDRVVLAVTEGAMTLAELARLLAAPEPRGGPGLTMALNLDGGSSTMLDIDAGPVQIALRSAVQVPVGIAVVARDVIAARLPGPRLPLDATP